MWLDIVDNWMNNYGLVIVGLLECIAVGYFADFGKLRTYINDRSEIHLDAWFDLFVRVITPAVLIYLLGAQFGKDVQKVYGGYDTVVSWSVSVAGWGWIFSLLLISLILARDWIAFSWVASALAIFGLFRLGLDNSSSAMGALGMTLLFGGLITCLWVAMRRRPAKGTQISTNG
jgi:hypothetical protein